MKNTRVSSGILMLAAVLGVSALSYGQSLEEKKGPDSRIAAMAKLLERYDANKNGRLDADEVEKIGRDRMRGYDRNKDGRVDAAELRAMRENSRKMPEQDDLDRAMAREAALNAARIHKAEVLEKKNEPAPKVGQSSSGGSK